MKLNIQRLQAAVALVIASLQPQPKAVACQPLIVEKVYEMGTRVNKTDVRELTEALNTVAAEIRESRTELELCADKDFYAALTLAADIKNRVIHLAGITQSFVLMLPEKEVIMSYAKDSAEFLFLRAVKMLNVAAKNYLSLIEQLMRKTGTRESGIDINAMRHLLETGNKAASKWL